MSTYYSIIFASIRKATQEKISLGFILFNEDMVLCKFSYSKLAALKHFLSKDEFKIVNESINVLEKKVRASSEILHFNSHSLFKVSDSSFSVDYINYLSRYKNNLVTYLQPKKIDIEVSVENAMKLFDNLVGSGIDHETNQLVKKISPIDYLKEKYDGKIQSHFLMNHTITFEDVPNLLVPVKVDLLGKNGIDVFVQSIDMTSAHNLVINEVSTFYLLKETYNKNKVKFKDFVLTQEPPKELKNQHSIWRQIKDSKEFNYVDVSESGKIMEYAEKYNVRPIFGKKVD